MGCLPRSACLRSLCLTRHLNLLDIRECLEIRDYQLCEWSTPTGLKLARENLQSRVKEEDSITDVENAVFDLGVMDSLWPSKLCARAQSEDDMPSRTLTCMRSLNPNGCFVSCAEASKCVTNLSDLKRHDFLPTSLFKNSFRTRLDTPTFPTCFVDDTAMENDSDSYLSHDLCKIGHCKKWVPAITIKIARGAPNLAKRDLRICKQLGIIGGERFWLHPILMK
ncbi:hypothetical protein Tco_0909232 [Tanacetum coccineum]|uniref:Uncharacterized protein n=1 Tax=Tanacetum coccineum TaxID=301880 RepID=A0ABQ5CRF8_9ASTR